MAYAYKRNGRIWIGYKDASGRPVREPCLAAQNLTQGRRLAQQCEDRHWNISHGLDAPSLRPTLFSEVAKRYLEVQAPTLRSFETIKQRIEDHVLPSLGSRLLGEISAVDIQSLLNDKARKRKARDGKERRPLSPQTRQHILNHIQAIFSFAVEKLKVTRDNPAAEVDRVLIPERAPKAFDTAHVSRIIAHVPDRWRGLFATAVYTGLRKGELLGLRVRNVDMEGRFILVEHSYDGTTKAAKVRSVPIPDGLVPYLRVELGRVRSEYLFPSLTGGMQNRHCNLPRTLRNAMKAGGIVEGYNHKCRRKDCGHVERQADDAPRRCPKCNYALWVKPVPLNFSFKDLRSTCATHSYEATGDIRYVKELLGHSATKVTEQRYAKMRSRRMLEQANKLSFATHNPLTDTNPETATAGSHENFPQGFPPLHSARGRGLEPLTSGVTGRVVALSRIAQPSQAVDIVHEAPAVSLSGVSAVAQASYGFTHPELTGQGLRPLEGEGTRYLSVAEVAERLGLTPQTVYLLLQRGQLRSVRKGGRHLVAEDSLPSRAAALLSVAEVAERAGVPEKRVRKWIEKGRLAVTRVGLAVRVAADELERFLQSKGR